MYLLKLLHSRKAFISTDLWRGFLDVFLKNEDSCNFRMKLIASIKTSDGKLMNSQCKDFGSKEIKVEPFWGFYNFIKIVDIFNLDNKYLENDCITLVIDVSGKCLVQFKKTFIFTYF